MMESRIGARGRYDGAMRAQAMAGPVGATCRDAETCRTGRNAVPSSRHVLTSLCLQNWKSFGDGMPLQTTLRLAPLTFLVGPNGSGKSNALDAIRFLQGIALDYPIADVLRGRREGEREVWPPIRGAAVEVANQASKPFMITSNWELTVRNVEHSILVSASGEPVVEHERLRDGGMVFADTGARGLEAIKKARSEGLPGRRPNRGSRAATEHSWQHSLLGQLLPDGKVIHGQGPLMARAVRASLRDVVFLDIRPSLMRDYRPAGGGHVGASGENVSPALAELTPELRGQVVDWLSELSVPQIESIDFDRTKLDEVMMILVEKGGTRISARSASDGTLRFLGLVVALLTIPDDSLLIVEEPDLGLHPTRVRLIAELLEQTTRERDIQVVATTHSPTLLQFLSKETLGDVIGFARDFDTGSSICSRLADLPSYPSLRDAENLERLVSTGWVERAL
jgi:predicted ATPase